jgi:hypothetical protein
MAMQKIHAMFRTALVGAAVVVAGIGYPFTANAQPSMCGPGTYQNAYGVCLPTAGAPWSAPVDTGPDADFYRLLTDPDQSQPMVIWNFPLVKGQALWACQRMNFENPYLVTKELQASGGYSFDAANDITSAGMTIYCPQNAYTNTGGKWPAPVPVSVPAPPPRLDAPPES